MGVFPLLLFQPGILLFLIFSSTGMNGNEYFKKTEQKKKNQIRKIK
jgi:hypothetical protein